jgi:hypothetical protein
MKQGTIISILIFTSINIFGQKKIPEYDYEFVKGVDSIEINIKGGSNIWREMYYYNNGSRIKASSSYMGNQDYYRLYKHDAKKGLRLESYYGKTYKYDSDKKDWIASWDLKSFSLIVDKYSGSNILESKKCDVHGADTTVNQITVFAYDIKSRIVSETTQDIFVGLVGNFKSNSNELAKLDPKSKTIVYSKTYSYSPNKIEILYKTDGKLTGKEIITLNQREQVISIRHYDPKNTFLFETTALYDESGKMISRTWKTASPITIWGGEGDVAGDGTETIEYDKIGRPIRKITTYTSGHKTTEEYRYY